MGKRSAIGYTHVRRLPVEAGGISRSLDRVNRQSGLLTTQESNDESESE